MQSDVSRIGSLLLLTHNAALSCRCERCQPRREHQLLSRMRLNSPEICGRDTLPLPFVRLDLIFVLALHRAELLGFHI